MRDNLEIKDTKLKGKGVFSNITYNSGDIVLEITGPIIYKKDIPKPFPPESNNYFQIGKDYYIGLSGSFDDFINHSCNPNCMVYIVGQRAFIKALVKINIGAEITIDYSSTCNEYLEDWSMNCLCGHVNCRKIISGFQYIDSETQKKMIEKGIVAKFLTKV